MSKHVPVQLTEEQRATLLDMIRTGNAPARVQTRVRILLLSDHNLKEWATEQEIAQALLCNRNTVGNIRRRFVKEGLQAALSEKPRPGQKPKLDGAAEAHLLMLACSQPPEGKARWTLQMLADKLVTLGLVESLSDVAVMKRLKKTRSSPGR